jgi:hypothetical protein
MQRIGSFGPLDSAVESFARQAAPTHSHRGAEHRFRPVARYLKLVLAFLIKMGDERGCKDGQDINSREIQKTN